LQGEVVPATQKDPEGWGPADKLTVVLEIAGLNSTELGAYCRERGLLPEQVNRWRQAKVSIIHLYLSPQDIGAIPLLHRLHDLVVNQPCRAIVYAEMAPQSE
jgi:hypothetical protein